MFIGLNALPFPLIHDSLAMREDLREKSEIRFMLQPNGATVCSYVVSMEGTFDTAFAREARGIVFDNQDRVIARPLHKFLNINESPTVYASVLKWPDVQRVMVKRDGSMIHTVSAGNGVEPLSAGLNFTFKSKKSFTSDVVKAAADWLLNEAPMNLRENIIAVCSQIVSQGQTAIFEWTSPLSRIVVAYPTKALTLLHVRDNISGRYTDKSNLENLTQFFQVPLVDEDESAKAIIALDLPIDERLAMLSEIDDTNIEGWVFQFSNGDMVKAKTKAYVARHRILTFLRRRDIAEAVLLEEIDDLKAQLVSENVNISEILQIEADVVEDIEQMLSEIDAVYSADRDLSRKDFALKHTGKQYFGLIMKRYSGQEPDVKDWYRKHKLSEKFDLTQINLLQIDSGEIDE